MHRQKQAWLNTVTFGFTFLCITAAPPVSAAAQDRIVLDVGIRSGVPFDQPVVCGYCRTFFPSYSSERSPYSLGPAVSLLFDDRLEIRLEAVYKRVNIRGHSTVPPAAGYSFTSMTRARSWEYPLLATYRFHVGRLHPFAGGGIGYGGNITGSTETQRTELPSGIVSNTTSDYSLGGQTALYISGGFDSRNRYVSIRPELRYARRADITRGSVSPPSIVHEPNQWEMLVGISVNAFRIIPR